MTKALFDRFCCPSTMMDAELELIELGLGAIPILESLFIGEARNQYGVPYRKLGLPVRCAMEVAARLGPIAKPLEPYLRDEVAMGDPAAAMCLRYMGSLEEDTVKTLVHALGGDYDMSAEAALTLIMCGTEGHPRVLAACMNSERATALFERTRIFAKRYC